MISKRAKHIEYEKNITNVVFDFGGVVAPADLGVVIGKFKALGFENIEIISIWSASRDSSEISKPALWTRRNMKTSGLANRTGTFPELSAAACKLDQISSAGVCFRWKIRIFAVHLRFSDAKRGHGSVAQLDRATDF